MTFSTETPDAILDVIDGGFRTIPPLGFEYLGDLSRPHRKWKLKDTPSHAAMVPFRISSTVLNLSGVPFEEQ
jgi:hypothetical protein